MERIRKRKAFADPELNRVSDVTLLNATAASHMVQPAYHDYDSIPGLKNSYSLPYHSNKVINYVSDLPIVCCSTNTIASPTSSVQIENNEEPQTPIIKKPKLNFSIDTIMGFK